MKVLEFIGSIIDRLCIVLGAFIFSQIPAFMQQYTQRLGGHVEELSLILDHLKTAASYSNKSFTEYVHKFLSNSDPDFIHQGEFMLSVETRLQQLKQSLFQLTHSSIWEKPYIFIKNVQYDIAKSTFASFQPSINLTVEGLCYTGVGIIVGFVFYRILARFLSWVSVRYREVWS